MDLGLSAPGAIEHLKASMRIIDVAEEVMDHLPRRPASLGVPGTDLHRWVYEELPDPPVDPRLSILSALDNSIQCLTQIRRFVEDPRPTTTPLVLAALMRGSLLSGARPVFMLGPLEPEKRKANILRVMRQETDSLFRCYDQNIVAKDLVGLVPPEDVLVAQGARRDRINQLTKPLSEGRMLQETAGILGYRVAARLKQGGEFYIEDPQRQLKEHLLWIFNAYSGTVHGYGWPRLVPHPGDLPGDFVTDLHMLATLTHMAVHVTEEAHLGHPVDPAVSR